jgi:alpha-glucosidase
MARKRAALAFTLTLLLATCAQAQVLARPGWSGSGITAEPWWKHAVIYEIYPGSFQDSDGDGIGDLKGITQRMDYLQSLGPDAISLSPLYAAPQPGGGYTAIDPRFGTLDDFDALIREASRHDIRVLLGMTVDDTAVSEKALLDSERFWLNHGVGGFELYAAAVPPDAVHTLLRDMRKVADAAVGHRVLIGQAGPGTADDLLSLYGHNDELQLPMDTQLAVIDKLDVAAFRNGINDAETKLDGNQPLFVFDNPDNPRSWDRYSAGVTNPQDKLGIARILATVLLATRGVAQVYYGQEIGMPTMPPTRREDVRDPAALVDWPQTPGRDGERMPMPWDRTVNAGFTLGTPWLPMRFSGATANVAAEETSPDSLLNWYRKLIALRRSNQTLRSGSNIMLNHDAQNALVWLRKPSVASPEHPAVVIACNFSAQPVTLSLKAEMKSNTVRGSFLRTLARTDAQMGPMDLDAVHLAPYGVYIGEVRF